MSFGLWSSRLRLAEARDKEGLKLVEIRLLDHLTVAGEGVVLFAERGLL